MKRHQIRQMLGREACSDAQLRKAIADLNLSVEDEFDYSDAEAKQIIQKIKGSKPAQQQTPSDRHSQATSSAASAMTQTAAALTSTRQSHFAGVQAAIERISANREDAVEQVSDVLAYLNSKETFEADVMRRTAEKLGLQPQKTVEVESQLSALDDLAGAYQSFSSAVKYPAIAPHSALGCLPM